MRKILLLFGCIGLITIFVKGQVVYRDSPPYQDKETLHHVTEKALEIIDSIVRQGLNTQRADILEIKNEKYLLVDGTFDVFHWEKDKWKNLYKGIYFGYNFGSKKFIVDDEIYSFGGYGYWNVHGQIIQFLKERGSWELIDGPSPPYGIATSKNRNLIVYASDSVFSVNIDKKTMKVRPMLRKITRNSYLPNKNSIELENYVYIHDRRPYYLIDKKNDSLFESKLSPFNEMGNALPNGIIYTKGDSMFCYNRDFNLLGAYNALSEKKFFMPIKVADNTTFQTSGKWLIVLLASIVISAIIYFLKRKKHISSSEEDIQTESTFNLEHPLIIELLNHKDVELQQDKLDEIFEIDHIQSSESKRFRRSQKIKEINQLYHSFYKKELIIRIKDPLDKRMFKYRIQG